MELRIALCQCDIAWEQPARNLARLEPMVAAADADVVLLPELFATGFTLAPAGVAEGDDGAVVTALRRWAARYGKAFAGSVAVAEGGRFFNRMYFVKPSGEFIGYDKRHLFAPGGEARQYTPGDSRQVDHGGVSGSRQFAVTICVFRSGAVAGAITTPFCAAPRGLRRGAKCGGRCCAPGPSKTSAMQPGRIGWGMTLRPVTPGIRRWSTSRAARWPKPAAGNEF